MIIDFLKIIILAVFQGVAEFLPISSSGHLAVLGKLLNISVEENFNLAILLHFGTLLSIMIYYFKDLLNIIIERNWKLIVRLFFGSLPVAIVGFAMKALNIESEIFDNLLIIGICFIFTATLLIQLNKIKSSNEELKNDYSLENLPIVKSFIIGLFQAIAILPGVSRSGSTIFAGLKVKLNSKDSAKFSFFLGLIAIGGATLLEAISLLKDNDCQITLNSNTFLYLIGMIIATITGYFSLKLLIKVLEKGKLIYFSYYLYIVGAITLICFLVSLF